MKISVQRIRESFETHGVLGLAVLCLRLPLAPILRTDFGVRLGRAYHGWMFDRRFGVHTSGWIRQPSPSVEGTSAQSGKPYDGSNPAHFKRIVENLEVRYEDYAFVDFGSGKGRVLLLASAFPFRSVTGVEWSRELHEIAERNVGRYKGPRVCNEIESFCMDAGEFRIPPGKLVLYFFNPFGHEVMARVLENVRRSFEEDPREIILVYMNPRHREVFDQADFLKSTVNKGWFAVYRTVPERQLPQRMANVATDRAVAVMRASR
ncbi:MAG: class I SAM-dependent methyltransferase [Terriglobales bacterium]